MSKRLTAIIQAEPPGFVALCPEVDVASQGDTIEEAVANLREAIELFYECASAAEISAREGGEVYVTQLEVSVG
jgi:predicted RNase H-like HicB family nuclease